MVNFLVFNQIILEGFFLFAFSENFNDYWKFLFHKRQFPDVLFQRNISEISKGLG